uniref:G_PROTEIN_RECEP_F1_2 domain-containing protein n=1 Tax=Meloidogyne hapla TaxID=6305 RepID=A0A1I8B0F1_MELHA
MIRYVNLYTGYDNNMKEMLKKLTLTLILLAIIPFLTQLASLIPLLYLGFLDGGNGKDFILLTTNILHHAIPLFNPIIAILTNKPYRKAIFCKSTIEVQPNVRWVDNIK